VKERTMRRVVASISKLVIIARLQMLRFVRMYAPEFTKSV